MNGSTGILLSKLTGVKKAGKGWVALCPAHEDHHPSLSIADGDNGGTIINCHRDCEPADIVSSVGMTLAELCPQSQRTVTRPLNGQPKDPPSIPSSVVGATYSYTDETLALLYQTCRKVPKGFFQRRPDDKGDWINSLGEVRRVLYRLHHVIKAVADGRPIWITEGEKDADALGKLGLAATTNVGGAGKWLDSYSEVLRGADVVILPDNDDAGRKHGEKVATALEDIATMLRVVELPGLPEKGDVSDWLDAGGTREDLEEIAYRVSPWRAPRPANLVCMADIEPEEVSWLWHPYIAMGKLTLFEGDPGLGKSWVVLGMATAISLGKGLPGMVARKPASVLLVSVEDGLGDTIRPRLDAMGADVKHIHAHNAPLTLDPAGLAELESEIRNCRPDLLIIDPIMACIGGKVDIHRSNEVRAVMSPLAAMAEKYALALVCVRHLTKAGGGKALYRGIGSIEFSAAARSVLMAGKDESTGDRGIVHVKSNLALNGPAIGYKVSEGCLYWTGETSLTEETMLHIPAAGETGAILDAQNFLREELAGGERKAKEVQSAARENGIASATLYRAKGSLNIRSRRESEAGQRGPGFWYWLLPQSGAHMET